MLRKLQLLMLFMAISLASFAQDWIEVSSDLPSGQGIGQISVGMNDSNALWAAAIDATGAIIDGFTRSTDGGQTWTSGTFNAGTGLSMIFAMDASTCWAIFNTGANQGIYKTTDGGTTWAKQGTAYGASSFANVVHFFNANDGFAQGDPIDGYYELYTTNDGGASWNRVPEANIPAPTTGEYGITGNYSAVGNSIWWGTNQGRIFFSSDKGMTWGTTLTPFGATNVVQPLFKSETVGIAFRSYLDMGLEPELDVTTDGGVTWSSVFVNGSMYARWFDYIPGTTGTWLGSSSEPTFEGIGFSLDDGANWNDLTAGVPVQSPEFMDNQTGWAGTWSDGSSTGILIYNGDPIGGGSGAEIVEDFESYNAGEKLVEQALAQGLDYWTCWSGDGGAGGDEDATVSTEQAFTGNNSVMTDGLNDYVMLFGDKTAGKYSVDFYMYVPSGFVGYYNILQAWAPGGTGATWGLEVYFDPGGIANVTADGAAGIETFNYSYDTWFHMENIINLNMDEATIMIDGTEVITWQWSVGASGGGLNQLAAMDIYASTTTGTPKFFMDDIQLIELEPAIGPSNIVVAPTLFSVELDAGTSTTETLTISNTGIATLDWNAFPQFSTMKAANAGAYNKVIDYKNVVIPEVQMTKGTSIPHPGNVDDVITLNYDGENASAVGLTSGGSFEYGAKFPTLITNSYISMEINEIQVYINDVTTASTVYVYGHGAEGSPGEVLLEQDFTSVIGWNNISLSSPVMISGGDIWVTCKVTHDADLFPAGNDAGLHVENGDWFKSGASWVPMHITNPALDANWNIRAIAEGTPMDAWIMLDPSSGEINGGGADDVTVTFDASDLTEGTYSANIVVNSNDPDMPVTMVPVTLQVTGSGNFPIIDVDPASLAFALGYNEQDTKALDISNSGIANLDVNMSITYGADAAAPSITPIEEYVNVINPDQLGLANTINPTPSPNVTDDEVIRYDDGINNDAIGLTAGGTFEVSAYWPASAMGQYAGMELTQIEVYINDMPSSFIVKIYGQGSTTVPGTILHEETLAVSPLGWNTIQLSSPVAITGNDIWIGYSLTHAADEFAAGCDAGPAVAGYGDMISLDGSTFEPMSALGLNYNWNIAATLSGEVQVEWLSIDPMSGMIPGSDMLTFDVTADSEPFGGPTDEMYYASIWIASNDPATPLVEVPVTLQFPVGMRDLYSDAYIMMFPNPASNMVNISTNYAMSNVKVVNQLGQVVLEQAPNSKSVSVNTGQLQAGIYFVKVISKAGESTHKLIVE